MSSVKNRQPQRTKAEDTDDEGDDDNEPAGVKSLRTLHKLYTRSKSILTNLGRKNENQVVGELLEKHLTMVGAMHNHCKETFEDCYKDDFEPLEDEEEITDQNEEGKDDDESEDDSKSLTPVQLAEYQRLKVVGAKLRHVLRLRAAREARGA